MELQKIGTQTANDLARTRSTVMAPSARRDERRHRVALSRRFLLKTQAVVTAALLCCGILRAQTSCSAEGRRENARYRVRSAEAGGPIRNVGPGKRAEEGHRRRFKAGDLAGKIDADRKRQDRWEISAWTLSNSALQPGESINLEMGNGVVAVNGTFQTAIARGLPISPSTATPNQKTVYFVTAPPEIRSRILMEGLRDDLNDFAAILQFDGKNAESDSFWVSWKSAWFDAQEVFCKNSPGAKFTNLNGEDQICQALSAPQSKTRN